MGEVRRFTGLAGEVVQVWEPRAGVLATRIVGRGTAAAARFYIQEARAVLARQGFVQVFHDWSEVPSYDPEARDLIRAFGKTNTDDEVRVRYLVSSKVMSMAIQTAGLVLGRDFESTTQREQFERWLSVATASSVRPLPR